MYKEVNAEANCIYNAAMNGISLNGATMYVYGLPACNECAKAMIQVGIKRIVMPKHQNVPEKWEHSCNESKHMLKEVIKKEGMLIGIFSAMTSIASEIRTLGIRLLYFIISVF